MVEMDIDCMLMPGELGVREVHASTEKDRIALTQSLIASPFLVSLCFAFALISLGS